MLKLASQSGYAVAFAVCLVVVPVSAQTIRVTATSAVPIVSDETWLSPSFTGQPSSVSVITNGNASFAVTADGSLVRYYWQTNGTFVLDGGRISGSHTATITYTGVLTNDNGLALTCLISNACTTVTSTEATLTVTNSGGGGGFTPADYSPLAWYAAFYAVTNTAGNPVANNDAIGALGDKSGNQNVLTAPASPSFVYQTGIQNSKPAFETGHNSYLELSALTQGTQAQPVTMYYVGSYTTSADQAFGATSYRGLNVSLSVLDDDHAILYAGSILSSSGTVATGWHIFTCIFDGASSVLRIDGIQVAAGDIGSASLVGFSLAGYQPDGNLHWRDYFGEALVFSGHHDATHITNMENYCSTNWGITIP